MRECIFGKRVKDVHGQTFDVVLGVHLRVHGHRVEGNKAVRS